MFQPALLLLAYLTHHSSIIVAHVCLGHWNVIGKLLMDNLLEHDNYYVS